MESVEVDECHGIEVHDAEELQSGSGEHLEDQLADAAGTDREDAEPRQVRLHVVAL
jgi:hypothetical protein